MGQSPLGRTQLPTSDHGSESLHPEPHERRNSYPNPNQVYRYRRPRMMPGRVGREHQALREVKRLEHRTLRRRSCRLDLFSLHDLSSLSAILPMNSLSRPAIPVSYYLAQLTHATNSHRASASRCRISGCWSAWCGEVLVFRLSPVLHSPQHSPV